MVAAVAAVALVACVAVGASLHDLISFKAIGLHYGELRRLVDAHFALAIAMYLVGYGLLGLFFIPGSALVVVLSGLLFGATLGIPLAAIGSTLAAGLAFTGGRLTLGRALKNWTHPAYETVKAGFARHALSYMMFLRLTPGLPFAAVNVIPAIIGVPFSTFITGTFFGLLPSRIALSTAGAGLAKAIVAQNDQYSQCVAGHALDASACEYAIRIDALLTGETIAAFLALAFFALLPALIDIAPRGMAWIKRRFSRPEQP